MDNIFQPYFQLNKFWNMKIESNILIYMETICTLLEVLFDNSLAGIGQSFWAYIDIRCIIMFIWMMYIE